MKLTTTLLKQLIKEEMEQNKVVVSEENLEVQDLRQKLIDAAKTLTGIQKNELDLVNLLIDMINLSKEGNINTAEIRRTMKLTQKAAEKVTK